jgi:hypothetical protein
VEWPPLGFGPQALAAALRGRLSFKLGGSDQPGCIRAPNLSQITEGRPGFTEVRRTDELLTASMLDSRGIVGGW